MEDHVKKIIGRHVHGYGGKAGLVIRFVRHEKFCGYNRSIVEIRRPDNTTFEEALDMTYIPIGECASRDKAECQLTFRKKNN